MTIPPKIVRAGDGFWQHDTLEYEKQSADTEVIAGRIAGPGTLQTQIRLYTTLGDPPAGVFDKQMGKGGYSGVSGNVITYDDNYGADGGNVRVISQGQFKFNGCLDDGQDVNIFDRLQAEPTTGKLQKQTDGVLVAIALKDGSPSGADDDNFPAWYVGDSSPRVITETITVTTNVGTMTHVPAFIEYVEATAGTAPGGKNITETTATPLEGDVYLVRASKTLTFNTTDAITQAKVRYQF